MDECTPTVDGVRHLSSDLKWNINHVDDISARAEKRLEALRFKLNRKTLEILHVSYIPPIVEYMWFSITYPMMKIHVLYF